MNNRKFTAIYNYSWLQGSYWQTINRFRRLETLEEESVGQALIREGIEDTTVFLFQGWPAFVGESEDEVQQNRGD